MNSLSPISDGEEALATVIHNGTHSLKLVHVLTYGLSISVHCTIFVYIHLSSMCTHTYKYTQTLYILMGPLKTVGVFHVTVREVVNESLTNRSVTWPGTA